MEKAKYIGYIWYSDSQEPDIFDGDRTVELELDALKNPFIVEAQLYSPELSKSVNIMFVDGKYLEWAYDVTADDVKNAVCYESNRVGGRLLKFVQRWGVKADSCCEGMSVMVPTEMVFVGFDK